MNHKAVLRIKAELNGLKLNNSYRNLSETDENLVDFCSNDYLGLLKTNKLRAKINEIFPDSYPTTGSGGSRLLTGNQRFYQNVEKLIAEHHQSEACLVFSCGYMANLAALSTFAQRHDTILYDEYCHASIRDGIRLSFAKNLSFRHNDYDDLYTKARIADECVWVVTESVFSMDGDAPDFDILSDICRSNDATLIVDEAHALGILGENAMGLSIGKADVRTLGFGKAAGASGGAVLADNQTIDFLINRARPFIYSTAPPPFFWQCIYAFYHIIPEIQLERNTLLENVRRLKEKLNNDNIPYLGGDGGILSVLFPGNETVKKAAKHIRHSGFDVRPILHPTVPKGKERIRICIHSFNTEEQIIGLANALKQAYETFTLQP